MLAEANFIMLKRPARCSPRTCSCLCCSYISRDPDCGPIIDVKMADGNAKLGCRKVSDGCRSASGRSRYELESDRRVDRFAFDNVYGMICEIMALLECSYYIPLGNKLTDYLLLYVFLCLIIDLVFVEILSEHELF